MGSRLLFRGRWGSCRRMCTSSGRKVVSSEAGVTGGNLGSSASANTSSGGSNTTWLALAGTAAVGTGALWLYASEYDKKSDKITAPKTFGKASVGGPFRLINSDGKVVTDEDYRGKFLLMYFGFTFCPDICPDELEKLTAAINLLPEADQEQLIPVMVSVDPYRDTPERVKEYLKDFHPKFEGLTGDEDDIEKVAKAYRVYFSKADITQVGDDYLMDHSIITYLISPEGDFIEFYGKTATEEDIAKRIKSQIRKHDFETMKKLKLNQLQQGMQAETTPASVST